jgi:ATP-binding protein involved in chromosome partitioning
MNESTIRKQLDAWQVPPSLIGGVNVAAGVVTLVLEVEPARVSALEPLRADLQNKLQALEGVSKAQVVVTAAKEQPAPKPPQKPVAPGVKAIIAVASGKGGVGKSTVAVNLAAAAAQAGLRVGLLDADIYGPSLPILLNIHSGPPELDSERNMIPPIVQGIKVMSIGFLLDASRALVWRGPMVHSAINQMLRDVAWGELDVLFVDMPPGTGDAQLTLAQNGRLAGAVIVSTPQDLALADARRGVAMFEKVNVPILGIIENMSTHVCSNCGHTEHIFGHGGAKLEAEKLGVPFLGELPLDIKVRVAGDAGLPIVLAEPQGLQAIVFGKIIKQLQQTAVWQKAS